MEYRISLKSAGVASSLEDRDDLSYLTNSQDIEFALGYISWSELGEAEPTAMWVEIVDGEYGDIFVTFSSRPYSIYADIFEVEREWVDTAEEEDYEYRMEESARRLGRWKEGGAE